ncbi:hypothetical protein ILYODFUR_035421 [Ilyodon furcidens]|uniref:Uncharacterized protein n=1 Tax=Ilyodon furcidens TaxID=33524 RepID=A0ABV0VAL0_9TELE
MASEPSTMPPYIRLATVYGMVAIRRTTSGLWAGRALKKLDFAKKGFLSTEDEMLWWQEVKNCCAICMGPSQLKVRWEGPGREKSLHHNTGGDELDKLPYKPVKVTDIFICGVCRITTLPRVGSPVGSA